MHIIQEILDNHPPAFSLSINPIVWRSGLTTQEFSVPGNLHMSPNNMTIAITKEEYYKLPHDDLEYTSEKWILRSPQIRGVSLPSAACITGWCKSGPKLLPGTDDDTEYFVNLQFSR